MSSMPAPRTRSGSRRRGLSWRDRTGASFEDGPEWTPRAADHAAGRQGTRNIAGPEVFALDELGRISLAARGDHRTVVTDNSAGMFAAASGDALIAKNGAVIAKTTYRKWLAR